MVLDKLVHLCGIYSETRPVQLIWRSISRLLCMLG